MSFAVGSLVSARGREWVVLPESESDFLYLRPLGGTDEEIAGVHLGLEQVTDATFPLPSADDLGDHRSGRLLRDAVRLGFRSSAGPFRSFGHLACEPRPYQLVPLLMALRQDPVRILIADDVGVGKTIEACLIARELLDRGEVTRLAVLCPPALAEQWQGELSSKFNITDAELVLASTARRLERDCATHESLFDVYPHVIVSTDYIKSDRRRDEFLRACPELVIVDEAHTCADSGQGRGGRHQRHQLLKALTADPDRHLILVTATPHSGKQETFRSLLALLEPDFANLPENLAGQENEVQRRRLAAHLVQRRRGDIEHLLAETPFPGRDEMEATYTLGGEYKRLFERALEFAQELVRDPGGGPYRQRVRWWSALALLRSLASSPAAAADTFRSRGGLEEAADEEAIDAIGRRTVLDPVDEDTSEGADVTPSGDPTEDDTSGQHRRLEQMAHMAEALKGPKDEKLQKAVKLVADLLKDGFRPIVFCRFIPTAEYVAEELRRQLPKGTEVAAVTGLLPPGEREERVRALAEAERRVLVCTDCLSEGINLQESFDAVVHYDLSWNPTRHEQREGRVDRYGQKSPKVRVLTYYGVDNQIDGVVLEVLLRKHKKIRSDVGISIPVPVDTELAMEAILRGALLRQGSRGQLALDFMQPESRSLDEEWQAAADREKTSRSLFAQHAIRTDEVARELEAVRSAIGSAKDVRRFVTEALRGHGAQVTDGDPVKVSLREAPRSLRDALRDREELRARFELPVGDNVLHLHRTHPVVEGLASYALELALDPKLRSQAIARRAGVIRTRDVAKRTTALLLRLRYHIHTRTRDLERALLAEDCHLIAFVGAPSNPEWLAPEQAEALLAVTPSTNITPDVARTHLAGILEGFESLWGHLEDTARERGEVLLEAHRRVRQATRSRGAAPRIEPKLPVDVLGLYVYLPAA